MSQPMGSGRSKDRDRQAEEERDESLGKPERDAVTTMSFKEERCINQEHNAAKHSEQWRDARDGSEGHDAAAQLMAKNGGGAFRGTSGAG
jgi:hypothetical protein